MRSKNHETNHFAISYTCNTLVILLSLTVTVTRQIKPTSNMRILKLVFIFLV
jgi:hypothetical protein